MANAKRGHAGRSRGFSLIELMVVIVIVGVMTAIAVPKMIEQRRLLRSNAVVREIATQMRLARQLAMSQQQAVTFQYDDATKVIKIIDHNNDLLDFNSGTAVLVAAGYPSTAVPATVVSTISLAQGGINTSEIKYGIPSTLTGLPVTLEDGTSMTPALLTSSKFNVTFQADGSVTDPTGIPAGGVPVSQGIPLEQTFFIYNSKADKGTAAAISVLGASGRIKVWRYSTSANKYQE